MHQANGRGSSVRISVHIWVFIDQFCTLFAHFRARGYQSDAQVSLRWSPADKPVGVSSLTNAAFQPMKKAPNVLALS
jgi:hypothetical protein